MAYKLRQATMKKKKTATNIQSPSFEDSSDSDFLSSVEDSFKDSFEDIDESYNKFFKSITKKKNNQKKSNKKKQQSKMNISKSPQESIDDEISSQSDSKSSVEGEFSPGKQGSLDEEVSSKNEEKTCLHYLSYALEHSKITEEEFTAKSLVQISVPPIIPSADYFTNAYLNIKIQEIKFENPLFYDTNGSIFHNERFQEIEYLLASNGQKDIIFKLQNLYSFKEIKVASSSDDEISYIYRLSRVNNIKTQNIFSQTITTIEQKDISTKFFELFRLYLNYSLIQKSKRIEIKEDEDNEVSFLNEHQGDIRYLIFLSVDESKEQILEELEIILNGIRKDFSDKILEKEFSSFITRDLILIIQSEDDEGEIQEDKEDEDKEAGFNLNRYQFLQKELDSVKSDIKVIIEQQKETKVSLLNIEKQTGQILDAILLMNSGDISSRVPNREE